jgi:hypothetical protein
VKGVSQAGNLISIKAINADGSFFGIKAISPSGQMYDVKGITMDEVFMVNGVKVKAHIKALPQE